MQYSIWSGQLQYYVYKLCYIIEYKSQTQELQIISLGLRSVEYQDPLE